MDMVDDPLVGIDLDDFESDIDKAIDELFVQKSEEPETTPEPIPESRPKPAPKTDPEPEPELLGRLKERLLTLDWEISGENIQAFEQELQVVSEKMDEDRHSMAVVKMTQGVLKYLHVRKDAAAPISVQFLHMATQGLATFQKKPPPGEAEQNKVMDQLLGHFRRLKAEIQRLKPIASPAVTKEVPTPVSQPVVESTTLEKAEPEAPIEQELILEELPEEEPPREDHLDEEPTLDRESIHDEEIILEKEVRLEEEITLEEVLDDKPVFEEPLSQEAAAEQPVEPEEVAPFPEAALPAHPPSIQQLTREASQHGSQLSALLASITDETTDFFNRLLKAVAGKPSLKSVESHFVSVQRNLDEKLANLRGVAGTLTDKVSQLAQSLSHQRVVVSNDQADLNMQVETIREAIDSLGRAATSLEENLSTRNLGPDPKESAAAPVEDIQREIEDNVASQPVEAMEEVEPEPLLDLAEDLPQEPPAPEACSILSAIYLANVATTTLAIPQEIVTSVYSVSKGKVKALQQKGHASLTDFKAAFRSIKRGITGPLAAQSAADLKQVRFPIISLSPETLGADESAEKTPVNGIVLLSTGERHGALFTDDVMQRMPYEVLAYQEAGIPGEVSGTATIEGDFEINIINPDSVLS